MSYTHLALVKDYGPRAWLRRPFCQPTSPVTSPPPPSPPTAHLCYPSLVKLSYVCSSWQRQSERNEWWEHLCTHKYGVKPSDLTPPPDPVKQLFVMQKKMLSAMLRNQVAACAPTVHAMPAVPHSAVFG